MIISQQNKAQAPKLVYFLGLNKAEIAEIEATEQQ